MQEKRRNPSKEQRDFVDTLLAADPPFSDDVVSPKKTIILA